MWTDNEKWAIELVRKLCNSSSPEEERELAIEEQFFASILRHFVPLANGKHLYVKIPTSADYNN